MLSSTGTIFYKDLEAKHAMTPSTEEIDFATMSTASSIASTDETKVCEAKQSKAKQSRGDVLPSALHGRVNVCSTLFRVSPVDLALACAVFLQRTARSTKAHVSAYSA
jgi:hypothetical protein